MIGWVRVIVSYAYIEFPPVCPRCLRPAKTSTVTIIEKGGKDEFEIPHCSDCARRIRWWKSWNSAIYLCAAVILASIVRLIISSPEVGALLFMLFVIAVLAGYVLRYVLGLLPSLQFRELGEEGTLFWIRSAQYTRQFLESNSWAKPYTPTELERVLKADKAKWLRRSGTFAAVYFVYLGIVLPFTRARQGFGRFARYAYDERVIILGIPFALAVIYLWERLAAERTPK